VDIANHDVNQLLGVISPNGQYIFSDSIAAYLNGCPSPIDNGGTANACIDLLDQHPVAKDRPWKGISNENRFATIVRSN